jgi:hypothetical protein
MSSTDTPIERAVKLHKRACVPHPGIPETDLLGLPDLLISPAKATMAGAKNAKGLRAMRSITLSVLTVGLSMHVLIAKAVVRVPEAYEFQGGYPAPQATEESNDDTDLTRAVTAYRFFYPTVPQGKRLSGMRVRRTTKAHDPSRRASVPPSHRVN